MIYLKQSTASQEVLLGPFVDSTDGNTAETALSIANTDIKIWVAGATTLANKNSGGATHISGGNYYAVLDATDTATLGSGAMVVQVSGALAVRHDFVILAANVYDSIIGGGDLLDVSTTQFNGSNVTASSGRPEVNMTHIAGSSVSTSTAQLGVNVVNFGGSAGTFASGVPAVNATQISGDATAADNAEAFFDGTGYAGTNNVIPTVTAVTGLTAATVHADLDDIQTRLPAALVSGRMDSSVGAMAANVLTATAINADAITAAKLAADVTTELQSGLATASAVSTLQTSVDDLPTNAELATSQAAADDATLAAIAALTIPTAGAIADAVWDEAISGHAVSGSTGEALSAAGAAGDPWITALPGAYSSGQAGYIVGTNVNATISSRASQTSVDDLPTNAELATALGTADDAVLAAVAAVQTDVDVIREYADNTVIRGTVSGTSPTTTTFTSSALAPAGVDADQFKGRILVFDNDTTTTALRGQATDITANSGASNPLFTFTALTTAPQSGDTFSIV